MLIGFVGKPSSGKTTLLNALCKTDAKTGNYPFTTIQPNRGVAYIQVKCPCSNLEKTCEPRKGYCINSMRSIPIDILDVAGLVPGASDGKGMGNQFLDDLRQAEGLIHVLDSSGKTDAEGIQTEDYDPSTDIEWLNKELNSWIYKILFKDWERLSRKIDADQTKIVDIITEKLSGLGATLPIMKKALSKANLIEKNSKHWDNDDKYNLSNLLRSKFFPQIIAANKSDSPTSKKHIEEIKQKYPDLIIIPTSGLVEYTLTNLVEKKYIKYVPGSLEIEILNNHMEKKFEKIISSIKEKMFELGETTGVKELIDHCVFQMLRYIVVYPVVDQTHLTDQDGRVLPDAFLVPSGITAKQFAGKIHTDFEKNFINAILVNQSNKRISASHILENGDIIKIISAAK